MRSSLLHMPRVKCLLHTGKGCVKPSRDQGISAVNDGIQEWRSPFHKQQLSSRPKTKCERVARPSLKLLLYPATVPIPYLLCGPQLDSTGRACGIGRRLQEGPCASKNPNPKKSYYGISILKSMLRFLY